MRIEVYDPAGKLLATEWVPSEPLDAAGVAATLNVVLGVWPLTDAANAVGLTPDDLVAEAEAWQAAMEVGL